MAEVNRLQAVLSDEQGIIGIASGYPLRFESTTNQLNGLPRGPRLQLPIVNKLIPSAGGIQLIGGTPGRNGMLVRMNPKTLVTSDIETVGTDCLTGFADLDDIQIAANGKGALFNRRRGGKWTEQLAHQGACTGILTVKNHSFVTIGVDGLLHVWDHTCKKVGTLEGHSAGITGATYSPEGNIITVSSDRTVRVWDVMRQRQRMFFKGFENPLLYVHSMRDVIVVIDTAGQVFTIGDAGKPVNVGGFTGYPCCSWSNADKPPAVFIATRTGTIHRILISG